MSKIHQYIHANTWYNDNGQMSFCVILIRKRENPEDTQPKAAEPCWQGLCQPQSHEQHTYTHLCGPGLQQTSTIPVLPANQDLHAPTQPTAPLLTRAPLPLLFLRQKPELSWCCSSSQTELTGPSSNRPEVQTFSSPPLLPPKPGIGPLLLFDLDTGLH